MATEGNRESRVELPAAIAEKLERAASREKAGKRPTTVDKRALAEAELWESIQSVRAGLFELLVGRQHNQVYTQARTYGMPARKGQPVNLIEFIRWAFAYCSAQGRAKVPIKKVGEGDSEDEDDADPLLAGTGSPALERYRLAKAVAAERANAMADRELLSAPLVAECHEAIAARLRWFGEHLRSSGEHAIADQFSAVLADARKDVEKLLTGDDE